MIRQFSFILLWTLFIITSTKGNEVSSAMEQHKVVPDVLPKAPDDQLEVKYGSNKVALGNVLRPSDVAGPPEVSWRADPNSFYTICMTDPDAPSRSNPKAREWKHWLVVNIPGNEVGRGEVLTGYYGAAPPKGTGLHRYVLVAYKQPQKLKFDEANIRGSSGENRANFSISKFARKYNLGDPVAGNFFQAENKA